MRNPARRLLQVLVSVAGLVPVLAGLDGIVAGAAMSGPISGSISSPWPAPGTGAPPNIPTAALAGLDSHVRYLSGLLLAIGLAFWSTVPRIEQQAARFRLLSALVVAGGLSRLLGLALKGLPPAPMLFGLAMELVVTPLLCWWQYRIAERR